MNDGGCVSSPQGDPYSVVYCTLQDAIADAAAGDVIHVASGTYVETGQIVIDEDLTIAGDPASKPVIKPNQDTSNSGDARGWWLVQAGVVLDVSHVVFDGTGKLVYQAFRHQGSGSFTDCTFREIKYNELGPDYSGLAICAYGDGPVHVTRCELEEIGRIGVFYFGSGVAGSICDHIQYTGKGAIDCLDYGIELGAGAVATLTNSTITNCKGVASSDGSTSAGILITTYYAAGTEGELYGNVITDNTCGIAVGYDSSDTCVVVANYNDVSGNTSEGIDNTSATNTVDAEKSWWGTTNLAVIATMVGGLVDFDPPLLTHRIRAAFAGNRLVDLQNNDGGWDWPLDDGNPNNTSPLNTVGPIGMGLAKTYRVTSDPPGMLSALQNAGALLLTKTNNFSPSDGYLAAELDALFGGTTYVDHVTDNFYGPLAAGTYDRNGAGTLYDTAGYVQLIRDARESQGIANLAAWDIGMGLIGAASAGADTTAWGAGVEAEIDELDGSAYYDVIGLAGAVYGLAFVGEDFDPTAGEHAAESSLSDLADILAGYQIPESGGFAWNRDYVIAYDYNEAIQETAYAILALEEMGGYASVIAGAAQYMLSVQLPTGGWENYVGSTSGENNEVTAEAAWGIWAQSHAELTLEPDADCYANGDTVTVYVNMTDQIQSIVGGQFFLDYDDTALAFVDMAPGDAPFDNELLEVAGGGMIDYAVCADYGHPGTSDDTTMAVITFTALADICTELDLLTFRPYDPPTRLSAYAGHPVYPALVDMDVIDDQPPTVTPPAPVELECSTDLPAPATTITNFLALGGAGASDNCAPTADLTVSSVTGALVGDECSGTISRTYTITDYCGNSTDVDHVFNVSDDTAPVVTAPDAVELECSTNLPAAAATIAEYLALAGADAVDNCTAQGDLTVSHVDGALAGDECSGTITRTYTITDECANGTDVDHVFNVSDDTAPVVTAPDAVELECSTNLPAAAATIAEYLALAGADAADNCTAQGDLTVSHVDGALAGDECSGTITRTYTITDECANGTDVAHVFNVSDDTAPVVTAPDAVELECSTNLPAAAATIAEYLALTGADAADNCTAQGDLTVSHVDGALAGDECSGTITRTYTISDYCGNSADADHVFNVSDDTDPVVTDCPVGISVDADAGGCDAEVSWTAPTVTDNCDAGPTVEYDIDEGDDGSVEDTISATTYTFPGGTHRVTVVATDLCGNVNDTCDFIVTVSASSEMLVDLDLDWSFTGSRCITFELWECATPSAVIVEEFLAFNGGSASAMVLVPCGDYECITARDTLHTLRRTDDDQFGITPIVGTQYVANFTDQSGSGGDNDELVGGNLNDDFWIDILDFGVFTSQWGQSLSPDTDCMTAPPHADINGSGIVDTGDFTFIQINFLAHSDDNCCGQPLLGGGGDGPITEISVEELYQLGLGHLGVADLNNDGWLDEADVAAFMNGARPKPGVVPIEDVMRSSLEPTTPAEAEPRP